MVGVAGFEPATSASQTRRDNRATLHPELVIYFAERVGFEPTRQLPVDSLANCSINHSGIPPIFKERYFIADANVSFHCKEHNNFLYFLLALSYSGYSILKWKMLANLFLRTFLMDSISLKVTLAFKN